MYTVVLMTTHSDSNNNCRDNTMLGQNRAHDGKKQPSHPSRVKTRPWLLAEEVTAAAAATASPLMGPYVDSDMDRVNFVGVTLREAGLAVRDRLAGLAEYDGVTPLRVRDTVAPLHPPPTVR